MVEVSGIMHGKMIALEGDLGLPDGEAVSLIVRRKLPPGEGIRRSAGGAQCGRRVGSVVGGGLS